MRKVVTAYLLKAKGTSHSLTLKCTMVAWQYHIFGNVPWYSVNNMVHENGNHFQGIFKQLLRKSADVPR